MPLTEWSTAFACVAAYLVVLFVVQRLMANREPMQVKWLFATHNLFLSIGSLAMLLGISQKILDWVHDFFFVSSCNCLLTTEVFLFALSVFVKWQTRSFFHLYCDSTDEMNFKGTLWFWIYVFYVSKYYEFLDTLFLVVKKVRCQIYFTC